MTSTTSRAVVVGGLVTVEAVIFVAVAFGRSAAQTAGTDLACGRPATASSNGADARNAVDCVAGTMWRSTTAKPQQLQVDLGSTQPVDHVSVVWGGGYAISYKVRTSPDGSTWHTVVQNTTGQGGTETLPLPAGTRTRWIQLYLSQYAGTSGFAVDELEVFAAPGGSPSPTPSGTPTPTPTPSGTGGRTVTVSTPTQLRMALAGARPGDAISLAAGTYDGAFYATASGTASAPITLTGPRTAVLSNTGSGCDPNVPAAPSGISYCGFGLHLNRVSYWHLSGFTVAGAAKGIVLDGANHNVIDGVEVFNTGDEGVHMRTSSSDNVLRNSAVHDTGRSQPGFGEGLYVGSAQSNWSKYGQNGGTGPDRSDRNQALNNHFGPNVTAEHIDIKEGTVGGLVQGNTFDGRGISGANFADSWVDVKGSGYTVAGNHGTNAGASALVDGYQVHRIVAGAGCGNVFGGNDSDLGGATGYAINVTDQSSCPADPNVVFASNTVANAGKGLTNIPVTAAG
jgi:parallel beta-helix repeat protein